MLTLSVILFLAIASYELPSPIGEGYVKLGGSPTGEIRGEIGYGRLPYACSETETAPAPYPLSGPLFASAFHLLVNHSSRVTEVPLGWDVVYGCAAQASFRIVAGEGTYQLYIVPRGIRFGVAGTQARATFPNGVAQEWVRTNFPNGSAVALSWITTTFPNGSEVAQLQWPPSYQRPLSYINVSVPIFPGMTTEVEFHMSTGWT